jgi:colanic acid/amylovoran biosynthesis glycosyltransferase
MLCIVGFDNNPVIKDFIRIHVERLPGSKVCLSGWFPDYQFNGKNIRLVYQQPTLVRRIFSLLPYAITARRLAALQKSRKNASAAVKRFLASMRVDALLVEFGNPGAAIAPLANEMQLPLVVHFHGHDAHRKSLLCESMMQEYKFMFRTASAILVVSRFMRTTLLQMGCPAEKLVYNPYGPRNRFFSLSPSYAQTVLSVGRFTDIKANYLVLMAFQKALQQVPAARLVMIGDGELLETCRTLAKVWNIEHAVEFLGAVEHSRVHSLFEDACCFAQHSVTPSYGDAEGTPNTILEASAAQLPVVSTHHAGIPDVVVSGETGYLVPEFDVDGMASALVNLLADPQRCRRMGQKARDRIATHFTEEQHIQRLSTVLDLARSHDSAGIALMAEQSLKVGID